jgi:hypothetical protein
MEQLPFMEPGGSCLCLQEPATGPCPEQYASSSHLPTLFLKIHFNVTFPLNFSLHHRVQNSSGAHPASYPMGTRGSFPGGKAARA